MPTSVVIPTYNGAQLLVKHLPAVLAACTPSDEVIIVDDASTDNTTECLRRFEGHVKILRNAKNMRFAASCNRGVEAAAHSVVILLNSDVSPEKDTFKILAANLKDPAVAAVSCAEWDGQRVSGRSIGKFTRGMFIHARHSEQTGGATAWATGGSMAVRKSVWQDLGGFDTLFSPAYYEDIDWSYRAWKKGWQVLFTTETKVLHQHETTNKHAFGGAEMQVMAYKNSFLFFWKNVSDPKLWLQHLCWLPYHLVLGSWHSKGRLGKGLGLALWQLPQLWYSRRQAKKNWTLTDQQVVAKWTS